MTKFIIGPKWAEDGFYDIQALQGAGKNSLHTLNVLVEVTDGKAERTSVTESNIEDFTPVENNVTVDAGLVLDTILFEKGAPMFDVTGITDRVSQDITITLTAQTEMW